MGLAMLAREDLSTNVVCRWGCTDQGIVLGPSARSKESMPGATGQTVAAGSV